MGGVAGFEVEVCKGELVLRAGQAQDFSVCGVLVFGFVSHGPPAFLPGRTWAMGTKLSKTLAPQAAPRS